MNIDQWRNKQLRIERKLTQVNLSYVAMLVAGALTLLAVLFAIIFINILKIDMLASTQIPVYAHPLVLGVFAIAIWITIVIDKKKILEVK